MKKPVMKKLIPNEFNKIKTAEILNLKTIET